MKLQKAKEYLENMSRYRGGQVVALYEAIEAVEIAEQEMMEKAVEAHRNKCDAFKDNKICNRPMFKIGVCDDECAYMQGFINQLNTK